METTPPGAHTSFPSCHSPSRSLHCFFFLYSLLPFLFPFSLSPSPGLSYQSSHLLQTLHHYKHFFPFKKPCNSIFNLLVLSAFTPSIQLFYTPFNFNIFPFLFHFYSSSSAIAFFSPGQLTFSELQPIPHLGSCVTVRSWTYCMSPLLVPTITNSSRPSRDSSVSLHFSHPLKIPSQEQVNRFIHAVSTQVLRRYCS